MYVKSSPPQQDAVVETWTADFLVFGQALYHWAILPPCQVKKNIQGKRKQLFIEFWSIMMEGCKDTFDFGVEMALISFVYEGIGFKFCLWLPVSAKNTME